MSRKYAKSAVAICDRSGFEYNIRDMVLEPGTNLFVYKHLSDGKYNSVDHPQNFTKKDIGDGKVVKNARPLEDDASNFLVDGEGNMITIVFQEFGPKEDTIEVQV